MKSPESFRPLFPDEVEEILTEHQHLPADLMERQALASKYPPRCLPDTKPPLQFREGVELVGPDEAREKF